MKKNIAGAVFLSLILASVSLSHAEGDTFRGWLIGEKCAEAGKVGECYLKWAYPMVLYTEQKKTYYFELLDEKLDEESLDKAFGREVVMEGWVSEDRIMVVKMTVLEASGKKEFFKG